jgi:hypothetical protein
MSDNKSMFNKVKNTVSAASNKVKNTVSAASNKVKGTVSSPSNSSNSASSNSASSNSASSNSASSNPLSSLGETPIQILKLAAIAIVTFLLLYGLQYFLNKQQDKNMYTPYIIKGTQNGKTSMIVSQHPGEEGSVTLYRSNNQEGAEFTYTTWLLINSMEENYGKWKHVFHKGSKSSDSADSDKNPTSIINKAPGVFIHPTKNLLRVYMNTYENSEEYVDIDNIPIKKWIHLGIILNHNFLDIYINGLLKHRKELVSLPRQNYGEVWTGLLGGFSGYLSKLRYYNYALEFNEIEDLVKEGPSKGACGDTGENPPYLDDDWWFDL